MEKYNEYGDELIDYDLSRFCNDQLERMIKKILDNNPGKKYMFYNLRCKIFAQPNERRLALLHYGNIRKAINNLMKKDRSIILTYNDIGNCVVQKNADQ